MHLNDTTYTCTGTCNDCNHAPDALNQHINHMVNMIDASMIITKHTNSNASLTVDL